jgi:glycosyltransferase involved in cell wall biosynthesis
LEAGVWSDALGKAVAQIDAAVDTAVARMDEEVQAGQATFRSLILLLCSVPGIQNRQDQAFFLSFHLVAPDTDCLIPGSGVDVEGFDQAAATGPAAQQMRAQLGFGAGPVVLTVTRLTRQKGIPTLLKAAEKLHGIRPDMRFVLVGPRETEGRLAISRQELDRHRPYVVPIGQRDDVRRCCGWLMFSPSRRNTGKAYRDPCWKRH